MLMNRRSFITKTLAGITAIPVLGKIFQARTPPLYWHVDKLPKQNVIQPSGDFYIEQWIHPPDSGLLACYNADDYDGQVWPDKSGINHKGRLIHGRSAK